MRDTIFPASTAMKTNQSKKAKKPTFPIKEAIKLLRVILEIFAMIYGDHAHDVEVPHECDPVVIVDDSACR